MIQKALFCGLGGLMLIAFSVKSSADGPGTATTFQSNGTGGFSLRLVRPWNTYAMPNGLWLSADFNGDGRVDLVHAVDNTDYVHTWISNGDGTFNVGTFRPWAGYAMPNGVWLSADINGDGKVDLVHAVNNTDYVHTWISNGDGTFNVGTFRPWAGYAIPNGVWLTADINGDGRTDIVHAVAGTDYVHTWTSNGNGTFNVGTFRPWAGYAIPNGIWLTADINGDGRTDIVHSVANTDYVHTWTSNGNGTFNVGTFRPWAGYAMPNGQWIAGDLNGDGKADLVHVVQNSDYLHTWISHGNGRFSVGTYRPWSGYRVSNGIWLGLDFSNDRRLDLVHIYEIAAAQALEVSRFSTASLTNVDADRILDDATRLLSRDDGVGSIPCSKRLTRRGEVTVFNQGNGVINSQADLDQLSGLAGRVKVVNQINWCGSRPIPNILWCAPVPGGSQVVVRHTDNEEGILWSQEYGQSRGSNNASGGTAILNPATTGDPTSGTQAECNSTEN